MQHRTLHHAMHSIHHPPICISYRLSVICFPFHSLYWCVHTGSRPALAYRVANTRHIHRRPSTATRSCPYTIARPTAGHGRVGSTWRPIRSDCIAIRPLTRACTFYIPSPPIHHSVYVVVSCTSTGIAIMTLTDRIQKIAVAKFVHGQALNALTPSPAR